MDWALHPRTKDDRTRIRYGLIPPHFGVCRPRGRTDELQASENIKLSGRARQER
jgi:hypothetical protein